MAGTKRGGPGNSPRAVPCFLRHIRSDYYNLACADAEEKKLDDASGTYSRRFERKANVNPGERLPQPAADDSILRHRGNRASFVEKLNQEPIFG